MMSEWREKAWSSFPSFRDDLADPDYSLYLFFIDLVPMVAEAHRRVDEVFLQKAYSFAAWCAEHPEKDVWNAAGVCFYEHLFDDWNVRHSVLEHLSTDLIRQHWGLWESRLNASQLKELAGLVKASKGTLP